MVRDVTGYGDAAVDRALDELLDRRIIQETSGRGILPYAFGHQLVQQAIAGLAEPGRLGERSRRMARSLKRLYSEREREFASHIAALLEAAGQRDEAASEYLVAGRHALLLGAPNDARRHIDRGLALAMDRATIVMLLQERQRVDERASNYSEEQWDLDSLAALAEDSDDEELRCSVLMRRARLAFRDYAGRSAALVPLAQLRERARIAGNLRWQAEADLAESMFYPLGVAAGQTAMLAQRALETYRKLGDEVGAAGALAEMARTLFVSGRIEEGRRAAEEALAIAERLGEYTIAERALGHLSVNAQDFFDRDGVVKWSARWLDLTVKAGDRRCEADALGQNTWPLLWSTHFLEALPILDRAATICRECGLAPALTVIEMNVAEFNIKLGSFGEAIATFERAADTYAKIAPFFAAHARGCLVLPLTWLGSTDRAVELGREALGALEKTENVFERESMLHNLAEAEYATGELERAIERLEQATVIRRVTSAAIAAAHHGAFLAAFYAQAGNCGAALAHAEEIPKEEPERSVGLLWPQRSAWCAAFAYHGCGNDVKANDWLDRAITLYEAHLPHLGEEQRSVFSALTWHGAMLAAKAGDWPPSMVDASTLAQLPSLGLFRFL